MKTYSEQQLLQTYPALAQVERREQDLRRPVRSFVLRGQRLRQYQLDAVREHLTDYALFFREEQMDFTQIFGNPAPVVIEIGFGMGEATFQLAKANPGINYLATDVFLYGFTKLLANIAREGLNNIKIMRFDARDILNFMVPDNSVSGFHIFFPDPWPKKKHWKRRLIQEDFALLMKSKLKEDGYVYCVTDWEEYALQMTKVFEKTGYENKYGGFAPANADRPFTGFERKGLEADRAIREIFVRKKSVL